MSRVIAVWGVGISQAVSTGYVAVTAKAGRSSAVGLYVTSFYVGGSFGAALGGLTWIFGGWPACVALVALMLVILAAIVFFGWARRVPAAANMPPIEPPWLAARFGPYRFARHKQRTIEQHE